MISTYHKKESKYKDKKVIRKNLPKEMHQEENMQIISIDSITLSKKKKRRYNRDDSEHLVNFAKIIMIIGCILIFRLIIGFFPKRFTSLFENTFTNIGGGYLVAELLKGPFMRFNSKFSQKFSPKILLPPDKKLRREVEDLFKLQRPMLSDKHIKAINDTFLLWDAAGENWGASAGQMLYHSILDLLSLPYKVMPIIEEDLEKKRKIDELLSTYSESLKIQMWDFINQLVASTCHQGETNEKLVQPIYLLGEPGVGKTRFASKIMEFLGMPYKLELLPNATREEIIGSKKKSISDRNYELGVIYNALKSSPYKNIVILLDEIDKAFDVKNNKQKTSEQEKQESLLLTWLLQVLDAKTTKVKSETFNFDIDISRVTFVLIGNENILEKYSSLKSRCTKIEFPPLTTKIKCKIAKDYLAELMGDYSEAHLRMVQNIALKDSSPGARVMKKVIYSYYIYLKFKATYKIFPTPDFNLDREFKKHRESGEIPEFKPFACVGYELGSMNTNKKNDNNITFLPRYIANSMQKRKKFGTKEYVKTENLNIMCKTDKKKYK